ncbi:hypothetical protein ACERZ8_03050 [Tateyamaria armeniaca]|uniref:Uncharacterized protein n=1 Tax=Tateyamaria armeniaca TaxID=2518930 RepID=A0ABW8UP54_9RHOB
MKQSPSKPVAGITAPAVRPTLLAAALVAGAIAVPAGALIQLVYVLFF